MRPCCRTTGRPPQRRSLGPIAHIGTLNEGSLHAALKHLLSEPGDDHEVELGGFVVDIRRGDLLIEVQTRSFAAMGRKLDHLLASHRVLIVHPIAVASYLHKPGAKPRRSPKRGDLFAVFDELVSIPTLLDHPHLSLEVVLADVDVVQEHDPSLRRRRGGFRTVDRRLREVVARHRFDGVADLARLLPADLPEEFTTADLATGCGTTRDRAQKMAYCLRANGVIDAVGRSRSGIGYRRALA